MQDLLEKVRGKVEIFVVLDGYSLPESEIISDQRVVYIHFESTRLSKKRQAINYVAGICSGKYLMSVDAHCMFDEGFDEKLKAVHQDNWVQIPRRHRLDPIKWCLQPQGDDRPPIDYEYIMWPLRFEPLGLHGFKWDERTLERSDVPIDDTLEFQGSCWFMAVDWFRHCGLMDLAYQGWGQEAEEIGFTTRMRGGRVITNKTTWYAHLHKGPTYGRMYHLDRYETRESSRYAYDLWVKQRKDVFARSVEMFWPLPGWPADWQKRLWD